MFLIKWPVSVFTKSTKVRFVTPKLFFHPNVCLISDSSPFSVVVVSGKSELGSELIFCYWLPRGEYWRRGPEGGQAALGSGSAVADHQNRPAGRH